MTASAVMDQVFELFRQVGQGELSGRAALERAAAPAISKQLTDEIALGLSGSAWELARDKRDAWRAAVTLHALVNAALDVRTRGQPPTERWCEIAWNWTAVATMALWQVPDPWLYKDALARATRASEWLEANGKQDEQSNLLHALGTLHLDPYVANRNPMGLQQEMRAWRDRAMEGATWDGSRYFDIHQDGYPSPEQALPMAQKYYRSAAALKTGRDRALSLKALAQTLHGYGSYGLEADKAGMIAAVREALSLLDPKQDGTLVAELNAYVASAGETAADLQLPPELLDQSLDASVIAQGEDATRSAVMHMASSLLEHDPARVFRFLIEAQPLFSADPAADQYAGFHVLVLRAFERKHGWRAADFRASDKSTQEQAEALRDRAGQEGWEPARFAAGLVALAEYSSFRDEEAVGVRLLDLVEAIAPVATAPLATSRRFFRAQLLLNEGVNAVNREQWDRATEYYSAALVAATDLRAVTMVRDLLKRLEDVVRRGGLDGVTNLLSNLLDHTDAVELAGGQAATEHLQSLYRLMADAVLQHQGNPALLWIILQLAKGRRFAASIAAGSAHRVGAEDRDQDLLSRIVMAMKEEAQSEAADSAEQRLADSVLLSPYSRGSLRLEGSGPGERRANLEHQFDVRLHDRLVLKSAGTSGLLATEDAVRNTLDDATVLLQYYFPTGPGAGQWLVAALTTAEKTTWHVVELPSEQPYAQLTIDGVMVEHSYATVLVASLREGIEQDPGTEAVSQSGREKIAQATGLLIQPIEKALAAHRAAGKSHLCIVPHGPLALAPFHLLGQSPRTLSDDWVVTYLPSLQLLATQRGGAALLRHRPRDLASFGLSFAGDSHYDEIPGAVQEAQAVAQAWDTTATVDGAATENSVRSALLDARLVHIATHGIQRPAAPSFHMFRLAPDEQDDGDFYAHELLGMDLRGLELVTLSACDTAVGRFDAGDNPHGLPATLFLAGAQTIIGTLWEAEDSASESFFTSLYQELAAGRTKLDAFQAALAATRKGHPQFRDWGAFYFAGSWS